MFPIMIAKKDGNDRGYTLAELIVVVSIIAIMIGLISLGVSVMFSRDAERVARTIDEQIGEVRSAAMSKPGSYSISIHTTTTGSGNYIEIEMGELVLATPTPVVAGVTPTPTPTPTPIKRIDFDKDAKIVFGKQGSLPATSSNGTITVSFDKANGSITKIIGVDGTEYKNSALDSVFEIKCTAVRNASKSSSVLIMPVTGRHYIE